MKEHRGVRRWPLFLIAAPAAVAVWSGWVGLGGMCGFGLVQPFPGIVPWHLDTAITLPVGVEAYGSYAIAAWLTPGTPQRARTFARRSAVGALALGMTGQVVYHLLSAAHATRAPWPVVVLVACLPVATLGFGVALAHLLHVPDAAGTAPYAGQAVEPESTALEIPIPGPEPVPDTVPYPVPADAEDAALIALRATLAAGNPLSQNKLIEKFGLTRSAARRVREHALAEANSHATADPAGELSPA